MDNPKHLTEPSERLMWARYNIAKFKNPRQAAIKNGFIAPSYYKHEKGERGLDLETAIKYANAYKINVNWLYYGEGSPQGAEENTPLLGYVGAGAQINTEGCDNVLEYVETPPHASKGVVAVCVRGDSMYPAYRDGDYIYYNPQNHLPPQDLIGEEVVAKLTNGDIYIKEISNGSTPHTFNLISHNAPPMRNCEIQWATKIIWVKKK